MFKTQEDKEKAIFTYRTFIADKIVDLQKFPIALRDPDDREGTIKIIKKIEDTCIDIRKGYIRLEDASYAEVEEEIYGKSDDDSDDFY